MRCTLAVLLLVAASTHAADPAYLRYVPSDTKVVLALNVTAMREVEQKKTRELATTIYRTYLNPDLDKKDKLPITDLTRVVMALQYAGSLHGVVLLEGKVDQKEVEKQGRAAVKANKVMSVEMLGKPQVAVFRRKIDPKAWTELIPPLEAVPAVARKLVTPSDVWFAALDDRTIILSLSGKQNIVRALRARPKSSKPRTADEMTALLRKQSDKDIVTFVLIEDSLHPGLQLIMPEMAKETFEQAEYITGRASGGKEMQITVVVKGKSEDGGKTLEGAAKKSIDAMTALIPKVIKPKPQREALEALFKSFKITRKDETVTVAGKLTNEQARKLMPVLPDKK